MPSRVKQPDEQNSGVCEAMQKGIPRRRTSSRKTPASALKPISPSYRPLHIREPFLRAAAGAHLLGKPEAHRIHQRAVKIENKRFFGKQRVLCHPNPSFPSEGYDTKNDGRCQPICKTNCFSFHFFSALSEKSPKQNLFLHDVRTKNSKNTESLLKNRKIVL